MSETAYISLQQSVIAIICKSRDYYKALRPLLPDVDHGASTASSRSADSVAGSDFYTREFLVALREIDKYYDADENANRVNISTLASTITSYYFSRNPKLGERVVEFILKSVENYDNNSADGQVSIENVSRALANLKEGELKFVLAQSIVNDASNSYNSGVDEIYSKWRKLRAFIAGDLDYAQAGSPSDGGDSNGPSKSLKALAKILGSNGVDGSGAGQSGLGGLSGSKSYYLYDISPIDVSGVIKRQSDKSSLIKVYPHSLNDVLDGGVRAGHHIVVFARPEAGKTAFCITQACCLAYHGLKGIYFTNEDRYDDLSMRIVSCMTRMKHEDIKEYPDEAQEQFNKFGGSNIFLAPMSPGSIEAIESIVADYGPSWIIIDQLRNLSVKDREIGGNKVAALEKLASTARNIAKRYNVLVISVTQAGDSATGKMFIDIGDVDFSNTGVPAAADLMIGIGGGGWSEDDSDEAAENFVAEHHGEELLLRRGVHLCKNKITGRHAKLFVQLRPMYSRYEDIGYSVLGHSGGP